MVDQTVVTVDLPDGSREEWTPSTVVYYAPSGEVTGTRPCTPAEAARVVEQLRLGLAGRKSRSDLWLAALAMYQRNAAFIAAAPNATYPLTVANQQALVSTVTDLCKTINGILKLLDDQGVIP
jgi:hypothetical protein